MEVGELRARVILEEILTEQGLHGWKQKFLELHEPGKETGGSITYMQEQREDWPAPLSLCCVLNLSFTCFIYINPLKLVIFSFFQWLRPLCSFSGECAVTPYLQEIAQHFTIPTLIYQLADSASSGSMFIIQKYRPHSRSQNQSLHFNKIHVHVNARETLMQRAVIRLTL